ncbi:MAG: hypothetical protein P8K80_11195 [Phycisphaerales bacterium]|nr:hypothetical protein [Phycisphaerales bacterium]
MPIILIILLALLITALVVLAMLSGGSSPLAGPAGILLALLLWLMALFCVYGFLASFEPGNSVGFKIGYALGFVVLVVLGILSLRSRPSSGTS